MLSGSATRGSKHDQAFTRLSWVSRQGDSSHITFRNGHWSVSAPKLYLGAVCEIACIKMVHELLCQCKNKTAKLLLSHLCPFPVKFINRHAPNEPWDLSVWAAVCTISAPVLGSKRPHMEQHVPLGWHCDTVPGSLSLALLPGLAHFCLVCSTGKSLIFAHHRIVSGVEKDQVEDVCVCDINRCRDVYTWKNSTHRWGEVCSCSVSSSSVQWNYFCLALMWLRSDTVLA